MNENKVVSFRQKNEIDYPLTKILRAGAKLLVQQAVESELAAFLPAHADLELSDGRPRVVRHGHDPVRPIESGIGPVEVAKPKARGRGAATADEPSAMRRRSCQNGCGARRASTYSCQLFICAPFPPAIFRKC